MQTPSDLDQHIDDTFRIVDGLPNFINEISFLPMTDLTNHMNAEGNPEVLTEPMEKIKIADSDDDI
jgi:hypothetical protein